MISANRHFLDPLKFFYNVHFLYYFICIIQNLLYWWLSIAFRHDYHSQVPINHVSLSYFKLHVALNYSLLIPFSTLTYTLIHALFPTFSAVIFFYCYLYSNSCSFSNLIIQSCGEVFIHYMILKLIIGYFWSHVNGTAMVLGKLP
jgi:hypothetical protein